MLPVNYGSHADYQNFVVKNLRKYYPNPNALARSTWDIIERFWHLDLSATDLILANKYSKFGPAPRIPSCMQRSYLLSIDFKVTSLTEWAAQLKINPLFAILSGFDVGNTPGVGTFYDFMKRLWDSSDDHLSPHVHPVKIKVRKPKTKGTKADSVEKVTVADLLPELQKTDFKLNEQPYASLFKIYKQEFLDVSVSKGLIHRESPTVNVTAISPSQIVISDGTLPVTLFTMVTTCTCLLIPRVIYLCSLITPVLQNMILMDFCMLFSG